MSVIPFYGAEHPELFAIERAAMDRSGRVLRALDRLMPAAGHVLDIGAGDGFTAAALSTPERSVCALEPSSQMIARTRALPWTRGEAEVLPFRSGSFAGRTADPVSQA